MSDVITGLFENSTQASIAIYKLETIGLTQDEISVVANSAYKKEDFAVSEGTKAAEGGIIGAFIPEHEIKYYQNAIDKGSILVGAKYTSDNKDKIEEIFKDIGADKVSTA